MNITKIAALILTSAIPLIGCSKTIISPANQLEYDKVVAFYTETASNNKPVRFYMDNHRLQQIFLIRHGEPDLDKQSRRSYKGMRQYIYDYDTVKVKSFSVSPVNFDPTKLDTIYASSLQRAKDTAHKIFSKDYTIVTDSLFREFEREVVPLPLLRLKPKAWGIWSHFFWITGIQSQKVEGFRQAKHRAQTISEFLEGKANDQQYAVLVSHGFLNRYLKKQLINSGWQLSFDGGHGYLSVQVLSKIE